MFSRPYSALVVVFCMLLMLSLAAVGCSGKGGGKPGVVEGPTLEITISVKGMTCGGCVKTITGALKKLPGVAACEVKLKEKQAVVRYAPAQVKVATLLATIKKLGYKASLGTKRPNANKAVKN